MNRRAKVLFRDMEAGIITESEEGYQFNYSEKYLRHKNALPISLTLPLQQDTFVSKTMFSFFDGLIPEGWLLDIAQKTWKIDVRDRMGLLLSCCKDCIGAVSVLPIPGDENE